MNEELSKDSPSSLLGTDSVDGPEYILLRNLGPEYENKLVSFDCIVMGTESRKAYLREADLECPNCHTRTHIECDDFRRTYIGRCSRRSCHGVTLRVDPSTVETGYVQTVLLQELVDEVQNNTPVMFIGKLVDRDVGMAFMGQKKNIHGIFRTVVDSNKKNEHEINIEIEKMNDLDEVDIIMPDDEQINIWKNNMSDEFIESLCKSFAPNILGYEDIKLSILLHLLGADLDSVEPRGWINILMVGDAGMAKTEMLRYVEKVTQKSAYTTGKGATAAGLTAGVVKLSNGTSILQAGIYPLYHRGTVAVDEFDKMSHEDRSVMHTVMEHGIAPRTVAGFPAIRLPAQVATLAAANPKFGAYNDKVTLLQNIDVPAPLLTRFDMIWLIRDVVNNISDTQKAKHIINNFKGNKIDGIMSSDDMIMYLNYARSLRPKLSDGVEDKLVKFYNTLREAVKADGENLIPINPRHLQSLIRLSTAYAKLRLCDEVTVNDVDVVIGLYNKMFETFNKKLESGGFVQTDVMGNRKLSKEKEWSEAWNMVCDDRGFVTLEQLYGILNTDYSWSENQFNKYFTDLKDYKGQLLQHGGKWEWKQ